MINLLEETIKELNNNGKDIQDVLWVGCEDDGYMSWNDFEKNANFLYDNGYGGEEIKVDLIIVGKDFWLERMDYDGSEWWSFKTTPEKPIQKCKNFVRAIRYGE